MEQRTSVFNSHRRPPGSAKHERQGRNLPHQPPRAALVRGAGTWRGGGPRRFATLSRQRHVAICVRGDLVMEANNLRGQGKTG